MSHKQLPLLMRIKPEFLFSNFVVGDNHNIVSILKSLNLDQFIYLWGDKYVGKTHLISALLQLIKSREISSICLNADSVSQDGLLNLLSGYEVLIIEDIQSLANNEQLELSLFNLFNYSVQNKKKLIVSSSFSAKSDKWQLPDLKSRLNSGQTLHLKPLKGDWALNLIFELMNDQGMVLDENAKKYIGIHFPSDFPSLFIMMNKLNKSSLAKKKKVTISLLRESLVNRDTRV